MDFNKIFSGFIEELKCSVCNNYLSYFPIFMTSDDRNICGRCEVPKEVTCSRNKVYEIIANEIRFPCRYINEGCVEKLLAGAIPKHEDQCVHRPIKCPLAQFDLCEKEVPFCDVTKHCELIHQDLILRDGQFEIDLSKSQSTKKILIEPNQIFVFETKFECEGTKLNYRLFAIQKGEEELPKQYELSLGNDPNSNLSIIGNVDVDSNNSDYSDISVNVLKFFKDHSIGKGSIRIKEKDESGDLQEKDSNKLFMCSKCLTLNIPPFKIEDEKYVCRSCNHIRTAGSDELRSNPPYFCKNQKTGCTLPAQCGTMSCPVAEFTKCEWTGLRQDLTGHITDNHSEVIATSAVFNQKLYDGKWKRVEFTKFYIIKMSQHFFLLRFFAKHKKYYWAVDLVGESEDNFHYELKIGTDSNYNCVIKKQKCGSLTNGILFDEKKMNVCSFFLDQLPDLARTLHFEIRIYK